MKIVRFRLATNQDKDYVLNFCKNAFSWGDYIDRVGDIWISEPNGMLLAAEIENHVKKPIAIIHGILIPEKTVWIEGIRVDPKYRRERLATNLINLILEYGRKNGAMYSAAIVSIKNVASKGMMEKSEFKILSKWSYISTNHMIPPINNLTNNFKIADSNDYQQIINFLGNSENFKLSGKKFVKSWRWHDLAEDRLFTMIYNNERKSPIRTSSFVIRTFQDTLRDTLFTISFFHATKLPSIIFSLACFTNHR